MQHVLKQNEDQKVYYPKENLLEESKDELSSKDMISAESTNSERKSKGKDEILDGLKII